MLGDEYGTASNIKSRVNRLSVLSAITSAQQRLKLYNKVRSAGGKQASNDVSWRSPSPPGSQQRVARRAVQVGRVRSSRAEQRGPQQPGGVQQAQGVANAARRCPRMG